MLVDFFLDTTEFISRYSLKMGKVKAENFFIIEGASLCCVFSNHVMKSRMKQVSGCMVLLNRTAALAVNFKGVGGTDCQTCQDVHCMKGLTIRSLLDIGHTGHNIALGIFDDTVVRNLSTHFRIEWGLVKDQEGLTF